MRPARAPEPGAGPPRGSVAALFLVFGSLGASAAAIPATLPAVIARAPEAASTAAGAVPALFLGVLVGVVLSICTRRPATQVVIAGGALQACAFVALWLLQAPEALVVLAAVVGIGFGLVEASATALVRDLDRAATARRLTALTGTVALVAAALPLSVSFVSAELVAGTTYGAAAVLAAAAALATAIAASGRVRQRSPVAAPDGRSVPAPVRQWLPLGAAALALALAVGVESMLAGSSAVIPYLVLGAAPAQAAIGTSAFWLLLASGRFAASTAMRLGASASSCLAVAICGSAAALATAAASVTAAPVVGAAAVALAVIGIGPVYSLVIGLTIEGARARWVIGALIAAGSAGGATIPLLLLLGALGPARGETWLVLAGIVALAGAAAAFARARMRRSARSTA
ncbi:hypothetical protein AA0Z99_02060 [Agrococcus sp. 1P02AA]|uniref:hypothetical protein n=1 Tax=Agrococcus sp. 1P02AA TaxID=3132259 RepID=UPI0039A59DC8